MPYSVPYLCWIGLCSVATGWLLISAIRICRKVEDRSESLRNFSSVPRRARFVDVALNRGVASDAETQALRRRMNRLLLIVVAGFAVMAAGIGLVRRMNS